MKKIRFRIVFADSNPAAAGELFIYRSDRPLPAGKVGHYRAAPGSEKEYSRAAVRPLVAGRWVSDEIALEATSAREVQDEDEAPRAVYSCVYRYVDGSERFAFDGLRVPASLSERTSWAALQLSNVAPRERGMTIEEAERLRPEDAR